MSNQNNKVIYIDETCRITEYCISLRKYYFPLPTSRNITFDQIEKITIGRSLHLTQKWGISARDMNNWFPHDSNRKYKMLFIAFHLKGKKIIPSFTRLDAPKVFNILRENANKHGFNHIIFEDAAAIDGKISEHIVEQIQQQDPSFVNKTPLMESTSQNIMRAQ